MASDAAALDGLGRTITLDLAAYLNRPVRCSIGRRPSPVADAWRYEAALDGGALWIDLDVGLARAFADAMIGGDGTGNLGSGRRIRALAAIVAGRMIAAIASAAHLDPPSAINAVPAVAPDATKEEQPLAGGLCAVATLQHHWSFGIAVAAAPTADPISAEPASVGRSEPVLAPRPQSKPVLAYPPSEHTASVAGLPPTVARASDPDERLRAALTALRERLDASTKGRIASGEAVIARLDGTDVAATAVPSLALALTAGGNGAVVALVDKAGVLGLASASIGAAIASTDGGNPGEVVLAAAEAVVHDALEGVAHQLPSIEASGAHRVVRLSDQPLPARTPHHAVELTLSSAATGIPGGGTLRVLVPSWMLEPSEVTRS